MKTQNAVSLLALVSSLALLPTRVGAAQGGGNGGGAPRGGGANAGGVGNGAGPGSGPAMPRPTPDFPTVPDRPDRGPATPTVPSEKSNHASDRAAPAQQLADSMHDINQAAFADRRQLLDSVDMRVSSSRDALKKIQSDAKDLRADARADFKSALDTVKAREDDLAAATKAARGANEAN